MASTTPGVWGIDLGLCSLKAIRVEEREGQLVATAFDYVEHPKVLSQHDADPDQLTREALEKFLSRNDLRGDTVAIAVPGQSGLARFVKLPPVEEKKIGDIVKFEAKQQIPFSLDEVVWDWQRVSSGTVTGGFAMETEVGLFAMKRDAIHSALQQFREVGIEVNLIQMAPLSLCNYLAYDVLKKDPKDAGGEAPAGGKRKCVVALDIGTDNSNLVITDGDRIIWQRPIPLGGTNFTRALIKDLKLTYAKAEHLKKNALKSPDLKKILGALKPVLNDFVSEVQRSLAFFTNTHRDAEIDHVVGLGKAFKLPGLQGFMSKKLDLEVRLLEKFNRLTGKEVVGAPQFTDNILTFGACYGLALQGLERARLMTNLLPDEIRVERLVRAKKPWVAAAVASLLVGVTALAYGAGKQKAAYDVENPKIKTELDRSGRTTGKIQGDRTRFVNAREATEKERDIVLSLKGAEQAGLNWMRLNKFIGEVVPRPGDCETAEFRRWRKALAAKERRDPGEAEIEDYVEGRDRGRNWGNWQSKLPPSAKAYLNEALKAHWYQERLAEAQRSGTTDLKTEGVDTRLGKGGLIQFNIEGFNARYTNDLSAYWAKVAAEDPVRTSRQFVRPITDGWDDTLRDAALEKSKKETAPQGKGWVIELRGYTYYDVGTLDVGQFILDVLGSRIAQAGARTPIPVLGSGSMIASGGVNGMGWYLPTPTAEPATGTDQNANDQFNPDPAGGGGFDQPQTPAKKADLRPISHVLLYKVHSAKTNSRDVFRLVGSSHVPGVVVEKATTTGTGGPQGTSTGTSNGPGAEQPASADPTQGQGYNGTGTGDGYGQSEQEKKPKNIDRSTFTPIAAGGGAGSNGSEPPSELKAPKRTEFVLLFIWREPTPSESTFEYKDGPTGQQGQGQPGQEGSGPGKVPGVAAPGPIGG